MSKSEPPKVFIVSCEIIWNEWNENISNVEFELKKEIEKTERTTTKISHCEKLLENLPVDYFKSVSKADLTAKLKRLSFRLLKHCLLIKNEGNHSEKAMQRVLKNKPPSKKGQQAKDCQIFESFLDIANTLRINGYKEYIAFTTSNTKDYGKPQDMLMAPDLAQVTSEYTTNLQWALSRINSKQSGQT